MARTLNRIAILDDYLNMARDVAPWESLPSGCEVTTFEQHLGGPDAVAKARICAEALWGRLRRAGYEFEDTLTELVGLDACHGDIPPRPDIVNEVVMRVGVKDRDKKKVERFGRELAPLVTSGPPGVTGFAGGRPKATEVLGYWPALIPKDRVKTAVSVEEV